MKLKILNCIILAGGPSDSAPAQLSQVWSDHSSQASVSCCCCCFSRVHDVPKVNLSDVHCNSLMAVGFDGVFGEIGLDTAACHVQDSHAFPRELIFEDIKV